MNRSIFVFVTTTFLTGCMESMHSSMNLDEKTTFSSEGEKIYYTGQSDSGTPINAIGGHHHMRMHGGACVTCHGVDRKGGDRMWPWFWITAPALTRESLLGDHGSDGHNHAVYDEQSIKTAITDGLNPAGDPLDELMPRWQISEHDLNELVRYLLSD